MNKIILTHIKDELSFRHLLIIINSKFEVYYFNKVKSFLEFFNSKVYQKLELLILTIEGININGLREGLWIDSINGSASRREAYYHRDEKEGLYLSYWPNGEKEIEMNFYNGKAEGHSIEYYDENNQKESEGDYVNGKEEGLWTYYSRNGKIRMKIYYKNGRQDEIISYEKIFG